MVCTSRRMSAESAPWLVGPSANSSIVDDGWVERAASAVSGQTSVGPDHGLLPSFSALTGPVFDPAKVDGRIADFYEHTSRWHLDLWSEWSMAAWPFGRAITALWSQRLNQLNLPMHPLDVSWGMDSRVVHIHDHSGAVSSSAWLRTNRETGVTIYSGQYGTVTLPGGTQPSVRVAFPLPFGCFAVLLEPANDEHGGLHLRSPIGPFGAVGAYLILERSDRTISVRRVPIAEHFHLYIDTEGDVRTDHVVRFGRMQAARLHYRLQRSRIPDSASHPVPAGTPRLAD